MRALRKVIYAGVIAAGVAVATAPVGAQAQQKFLTKPIRLVTGFSPGGQTDILARMISQKMSESWGQAMVVENRPGASGERRGATRQTI